MTPENSRPRAGFAGALGNGCPMPEPWTEPSPSIAHRKIGIKSPKGALRGRTLTNGPTPRRVRVESNIELKAAHVLLARPDVVHFREQAEPVFFVDGEGADSWHYFDFVVTLDTGEKVAIAVRPHERALRHDLDGTLRAIAAQMDPTVADRVVHMSEQHLPRDLVEDAKLLRAVRRDNRPEDDHAVAAIVATLNGVVSVGGLVRASGLHGRGFRAVVRLIGDGVLAIVGPRGITYATRVARALQGGR